ncbi:hypothetical protein [Crossiella sp. SN42]|nr:hypothetical protein [Crossiella sp. SN42]
MRRELIRLVDSVATAYVAAEIHAASEVRRYLSRQAAPGGQS